MTANDIINKARENITDFIAYEGIKVYCLINGQYPNFVEDEEYVILFSDLLKPKELFKVGVKVWDDWDTTVPETITLWSIHITLDDCVYLWDSENEEHDLGEISTDDLAEIAELLETKYFELIKK